MLYVLLSRSRAARSSVSAVDLRANADEWVDGAKMETFGLPRLQPEAFSVCTVSYFNPLRIFPGWKHIIFCPKIRLPSAVLQSNAFSRQLTSQADLDQKNEELPFLTPLHTNVLLWLWNLSRLGGIWNTDGAYGICDRAAQWPWKRIRDTIKIQVNTICVFLQLLDDIWFFCTIWLFKFIRDGKWFEKTIDPLELS